MTEVERERDAAVEDTLFFTGGGMGSLFDFGGTRGGVAVPSVAFVFGFVAGFDFDFKVEPVTLDLAGYEEFYVSSHYNSTGKWC